MQTLDVHSIEVTMRKYTFWKNVDLQSSIQKRNYNDFFWKVIKMEIKNFFVVYKTQCTFTLMELD